MKKPRTTKRPKPAPKKRPPLKLEVQTAADPKTCRCAECRALATK